ncbi:uncharacterized protein LOC132757801 [Ruditapes philippinarum]|uniref:uncharacterized protein LOC132757801 n=1 Tax=Ruditapes philippinarum TaxID=129788 RepID=UPI00295ACE52|nr:uncharacterized protein LOC132757801 [Ruditapes philippinarum]XP_060605190.1 uncharacterized protein LOC132757801 [Ruditapes philippinarum]XP_060605191.1 uncharacterized protein LOC132757801 [Ruditapes philippinarum]
MEDKRLEGNTFGQPLKEEHNVENRGENTQYTEQSINRKGLLAEVHKIGASRLVGFLYWTNLAAICLLMIGFVAPGWATFTANHRLYYHEYSYKKTESDYKATYNVYQDYALWYMTQCVDYDEYDDVDDKKCETMTYRTIRNVYRDKYNDLSKIEIGDRELEGDDDMCLFRGAGLVMSHAKITRVQTLYTAGSLLSIATLYIWTWYRNELASGKFRKFSRLKWLLMLTVSAVSAATLLISVTMIASVRADVFSGENPENLEASLGSVFAGLGGGLMALMTVLIFMQLICCRTPGTYICSCTDEPGDGAYL